jgi:membrane peptidoglycan carboxypeptidase
MGLGEGPLPVPDLQPWWLMKAKSVLTTTPYPTEVRPMRPDFERGRPITRWLWGAAVAAAVLVAVAYEIMTSGLEARLLSRYTAKLSYELGPGPSDSIVFPHAGPFDDRRGYSRIQEFESRLEGYGFQIDRQTRLSPELLRLISWGLNPPYRESPVASLVVRGKGGVPLFEGVGREHQFGSFEEIPLILVSSLLFMENRELLHPFDPRANPAIDWGRLAKAGLLYIGNRLGLPVPLQGGSTLATQLEKYQHSPDGRTNSIGDKLRQVVSATLEAYRDGADTRSFRRDIVLDYFNTVPLGGASDYGEINGLGEGLHVWFGLDLTEVRKDLADGAATLRKARAYKDALALLVAVRAPTKYLANSQDALEEKVDQYIRLLAKAGVIDRDLAERAVATPLAFLPRAPVNPNPPFTEQKAANAIRTTLMRMLDLSSLYELDRLDLEADSPIDPALQREVGHLFRRLADPEFVKAKGLNQKHLLLDGDPTKVTYSLMLFESTPEGNLLRVHADNLDRPFDINDGVKMDFGSTAKLRTLAHYLGIVTLLYDEFSGLDAAELARQDTAARDPITRWAIAALRKEKGLDLDGFLQRALDRKYSASPYEEFFTGGGLHTFDNFDKEDNGRILTVRQALISSTNLVFIRLMRDLVRYHRARLDYDAEKVLKDLHNPARLRLLEEAADDEARTLLYKAYESYRGESPERIIARLLGSRAESARHQAMLFFAWHPSASETDLAGWLRERVRKPTSPDEVRRLAKAYGGSDLTLSDYGYLLSRHPLEIWCAGELAREPDARWNELLERSAAARRLVSAWLFKTRNRGAQETRLRIRIEKDAFARMTPSWQRLGFPFERLVPTLATAIGNSSDRPAALAELMGIILNDGVRRPTLRVTQLHWGRGTPYETIMTPKPAQGERVMAPAVARALRGVLAEVVEGGTARRLAGAFSETDGTPVIAGGKTGSGDNRFKTFNRHGGLISSRPVNRTATFAFYVGDRYFGVLTAFVPREEAGRYTFTSALPVTILKLLAPAINLRLLETPEPTLHLRWAKDQPPEAQKALASGPESRPPHAGGESSGQSG